MDSIDMRLRAIANVYINRGLCESQLKLHLLLYYAQSWHLARHGESAFDAEFIALANGPYCPALDDILCIIPAKVAV